uniref:Immunoglobulin superfamily, member 8 n=1 Tax=Lepisosteus oculatus TaxID=7918 RepID=W5MEY3_LEPOC|nr:PREDICTED: immunoglobulin superfamily member 8 [Lepisosteus oculatus]
MTRRGAAAGLVCLLWAVCECRQVTLPPGPLYRVAGFPLSLPCSVTGYEGSRTQDFEWFLIREDAGGRQIGVISTRDRRFPYAPFQARVRSGEVRVERDSGDRVRLVIQRLRPEDQGTYECYTPSTDARYQGNYSSSVLVNVIPDTLQVSHTSSRSLSGQALTEGAELQLTCSASVQSQQHTHVSVTFGVRGAGEGAGGSPAGGHNLREVISIDKHLSVVPGRGGDYERRYTDGTVSLEKRSEGEQDQYVMRISSVVPSDTGSFFCEVIQWIQDPQMTWQRIAQRTLELGNVTVQPLADSLTVTTLPEGEVSLSAGSPLSLSCEVGGISPSSRPSLLVQWLRRAADRGAELEVARMGSDGVVTWGDDVSRRGGASLEKEAEGRYSLRLFSAHPADAGIYRCAVSVYTGRTPGTSSPAASQRSNGVTVSLRMKEVRVEAEVGLARGPPLQRGHTVSLLCNVTTVTSGPAQVEVHWLMTREEGEGPAEPALVAVLAHDGTSRLHGNNSDISVDRPSPSCYRLRVHKAEAEDQGLYQCHVEVWGQDPHGGWYNTGARSTSQPARVYMYARAGDLLLIPFVVGVSSALLVGVGIVASVTCCFLNRLAKQRRKT